MKNSSAATKLPTVINSMKMIGLVRNYELLYNVAAEGYGHKHLRQLAWEQVARKLFTKFDLLSTKDKKETLSRIKSRWKTLRNLVAREIRKAATIENYSRKKESPVIDELQFLLPHINSIYNVKQGEEANGCEAENGSYSDSMDDVGDEDIDNLVDLTVDYDIKPVIKMDTSLHCLDGGSNDDADEMANQTIASPLVSWGSNEYCTIAEYKGGKFMNSTVLCASGESNDSDYATSTSPLAETSDRSASVSAAGGGHESTPKRPRLDENDFVELQTKILRMISNMEQRDRNDAMSRPDVDHQQYHHDEDRMFLLSLVSDLKRVPAAKKMLVKAEITTSIARAIQQ